MYLLPEQMFLFKLNFSLTGKNVGLILFSETSSITIHKRALQNIDKRIHQYFAMLFEMQ